MNGAASREQRERLQDIFARGLLNVEIDFLTAEERLEVSLWVLPHVSLMTGYHSAADTRNHGFTERRDDLVFIWGATTGHATMCQRGRMVVGSDGSGVLLDCSEEMHAFAACGIRPSSIRFERSFLAQFLPGGIDRVMQRVPAQSDGFALLKAYLPIVTSSRVANSPRLGRIVAGHLGELVAIALEGRSSIDSVDSAGISAARVQSIRRWVAGNYTRPGVGIGEAAEALRLAPRTIQALLTREGTCLRQLILEQRLDHAQHYLLHAPGHVRISDIAYDSGFSDLSYFNHSFRERFGCAPGAIRPVT